MKFLTGFLAAFIVIGAAAVVAVRVLLDHVASWQSGEA
jgi:hypothetical protein